MSLSQTSIGPFNLYTIETGNFRLDGGAMFGVVPKTLWSRQIESDDKNRIPMTMRCLLIESSNTGRLYLVDDGAGTKFDEKFKSIYQIDHSTYSLIDSLEHHGFTPHDITDLILTHLHFDHCGGSTYIDDNGELKLQFPNARHHVTQKQWDTATHPNAREKASFLKNNIEPLKASGQLNLVKGGHEYESGLTATEVNGHTLGQQLPKITTDETILVYAGDLIPTQHHVPLPWVMGYDMRPVQTLDEKEEILNRAVEEGWYFFLEHDAHDEVITVEKENNKFRTAHKLTLSDIE